MAGTTLKHRPTAGAAGNTAPGKMPGADASSTELKQEPAIKEETVSMIDALKNEWHLFVFIFLGALVPSLSQLKNLHPQVAYIIRSVFQLAMFMSTMLLAQTVVRTAKQEAKVWEANEKREAERSKTGAH